MTRYLRCIKSGLGITVGKRYRIVGKEDDCYVILDDAGERHLFPIEIDDEYESYRDWFVLETEGGESMENVIEVDGVKYREVKRKAAVGEKIKTTVVGGAYTPIPVGEILVVTYVFNDGSGVDTENWPYEHGEYVVLEPITADASPEIDDIAAADVDIIVLQRELTEIKRQQAELTKRIDGLTDAFVKLALSPAKTAVPKPKTEQQRRDKIVAQAKRDVAELLAKNYEDKYVWFINDGYYLDSHVCDFVVNREKRTVVALIKSDEGDVDGKGIAKAAPGDVFNVYIGKAIALRRALGLPVPTEYTNAPQPEGFRKGDVLEWAGGSRYGLVNVNHPEYTFYSYAWGKSLDPLRYPDGPNASVIDDTDRYESEVSA